MADDPDVSRSVFFSSALSRRVDIEQRKRITLYKKDLAFHPLEGLMICAAAWEHVAMLDVPPRLVFAHPDVLCAHPQTSLYYRGLSLLSRKQVSQSAANVTDWEGGKHKRNIRPDLALKVARLYNLAISTIIVGSTGWSMENGYRNIVATMGVTLDGSFRNQIGKVAEREIKESVLRWMKDRSLIDPEEDFKESAEYSLPDHSVMRFGSEPDISFLRDGSLVATIEIKGGTDPAGALERLGAMSKSFAETPPGCVNFLVAGVITPEMKVRLDEIGTVKVYLLGDLVKRGEKWDEFTNEVFHYAVRVI